LQRRGYRAGDIAVLVRSNTQGARVARMLLEHKHKNPESPYCYDVVKAEALTVGAAAASRFIIACLWLAVNPADAIQRAVFNRWLGRDFDAPLSDDRTAFFTRIASLSPEQAFEEIVLRFELQGRTADIAYIQAVHQQITTFSARSVADIPLFLKWWDERGAAASITMQENSGAIAVSTIHKSKGLQYKFVIVPWLSWSMAPDTRGRPLVVWAEASDDGLDGAGAVPRNYKEALSRSDLSARYYREQGLAHIDAANLFYVAVTRAERELHLMASSNPRDGRGSVGNLLREALGVTEDFTEWGAPLHPPQGEKPQTAALRTYPTSRPGARVRLRLPQARYAEDGEEQAVLSPRDFGVLMHRAFENAATAADVRRALDRMALDALISPTEHTHLKEIIERAFANPLVAGWFSEGWETVRNEGDILTPAGSGVRRPDRVMVRGDRAVVVDYKFGHRKPASHAAQLRDYMRLLGEMGYTAVEGYLWYVSLDEIEKI
jgi:ATP-dependent exoDNAse (exonuclease V) beta subunit